jgi:hypothetical protein
MNEFEVMLVVEAMRKQGITEYTMRPGNDCIWVSYGMINCYYIFRDGKIADVQFD